MRIPRIKSPAELREECRQQRLKEQTRRREEDKRRLESAILSNFHKGHMTFTTSEKPLPGLKELEDKNYVVMTENYMLPSRPSQYVHRIIWDSDKFQEAETRYKRDIIEFGKVPY